jgi:hypothetical protein
MFHTYWLRGFRGLSLRQGRRVPRPRSGRNILVLEGLERRILPGFIAPLSFDAGPAPVSVAVGDFNGDRIPDLAIANAGISPNYNGSLSVLLGNGDGTFRPAVNYAVGIHPLSVAVGDFRHNGLLDVAIANAGTAPYYTDGSVTVLLGNGDGTFRAAVYYAAGTAPNSLAVGDFRHNGILDLAVADNGDVVGQGSGVSVLLGNGDGTFRAAVNYAAGIRPSSVAVGDFNGDGFPDLAVTNYNGVGVLLGNGDGTFRAAVNYPAGGYGLSVAAGDFRHNGILDLAVANLFTVSVLLGNGDGTFQPAQNFSAGSGPLSAAIGHFHDPSLLDLAVANSGGSVVSALLGNGDGTFQSPRSFYAGGSPAAVAVEDFNGDGFADLAVANGSNVTVLLGNGDGSFLGAPSYGAGGPPQSVAVGDFRHNGILDLAVANYVFNGSVRVLLGNGDGSFGPAVSYCTGIESVSVAVGDFRHNGVLDLAVANLDGTVSVLLGNGNGTFWTAVNYATGSQSASVAVGDFNGDGFPDLVVANALSGTVSVLLGNGDGTFRAAVNYAVGNNPRSVAVGDFRHNGIVDLAVANFQFVGDNLSILLGNGDGTFQSPRSFYAGSYPASVAVGDFRRNGIVDLAVANDGGVSVLLGNGDGTFGMAVNYAAGSYPASVAVGDFNSDGFSDLVVANPAGVRVLLGKGDGSFQTTNVSYIAGSSLSSVAVGDFNGDGWPDLAIANAGSNDVSILLNDGSWPAYPGASPGPGGRLHRLDTATNVGDVGTALVSGIPTPTQIGRPETMRAGAGLGPTLALTILDSMFARPVGINSVSGWAAGMEPPAIALSPARARSQGVTPWMLDDLLGWRDWPGTQMLQEEAEPVLGIE